MSVVKDFEGTITGCGPPAVNPTDEDKKFVAEVLLPGGRIYSWPLLTFGTATLTMPQQQDECNRRGL